MNGGRIINATTRFTDTGSLQAVCQSCTCRQVHSLCVWDTGAEYCGVERIDPPWEVLSLPLHDMRFSRKGRGHPPRFRPAHPYASGICVQGCTHTYTALFTCSVGHFQRCWMKLPSKHLMASREGGQFYLTNSFCHSQILSHSHIFRCSTCSHNAVIRLEKYISDDFIMTNFHQARFERWEQQTDVQCDFKVFFGMLHHASSKMVEFLWYFPSKFDISWLYYHGEEDRCCIHWPQPSLKEKQLTLSFLTTVLNFWSTYSPVTRAPLWCFGCHNWCHWWPVNLQGLTTLMTSPFVGCSDWSWLVFWAALVGVRRVYHLLSESTFLDVIPSLILTIVKGTNTSGDQDVKCLTLLRSSGRCSL